MKIFIFILFFSNLLIAKGVIDDIYNKDEYDTYDKYGFFLKDNGQNLGLLGFEGDLIKDELDKILKKCNKSNLQVNNYWKEKYTTTEYGGTYFNEDGYLTALLRMNNPTQADADYLKMSFTQSYNKSVEKEKNKIFERGELLYELEANWEDLTSRYSYSQLNKKGLERNNLSKLKVSVILDKIELINSSTCLAHIKIEGTNEALKHHSIPKNNYKYKGNYTFERPIYEYIDLVHFSNSKQVEIQFKFDEKKYFPKKYTNIVIQDNSLTPSIDDAKGAARLLLRDKILPNMLLEFHPEYQIIKKKYKVLSAEDWEEKWYTLDYGDHNPNYIYSKESFSEETLKKETEEFTLNSIKYNLSQAEDDLNKMKRVRKSSMYWTPIYTYVAYLLVLGILPPA